MTIDFDSIFTRAGEATAQSSYDLKGKLIQAGDKKNRFSLKGSELATEFNIAGKVINNWNPLDQFYRFVANLFGYTIEIKTDTDEIILLNINSIASRLHVNKEEIIQAAKEGEVEDFLAQICAAERIQRISSHIHQIAACQNILGQFDEVDGQLFYKDTGEATGILRLELSKGIQQAFQEDQQAEVLQGKSFKFWLNEKGERAYLVKKIGAGNFGKVYLFFDLNEASAGALKVAKRKGDPAVLKQAKYDIKNEFKLLIKIHAQGRAWGIQALPRVCKPILVKSGHDLQKQPAEKYGYLGLNYQGGDYFNDILQGKASLETRLIEFHQLLAGLKRLDEENILHGDIKPENVLCRKTKNFPWVAISDFGGACKTNKKGPLKYLVAGGGVRMASPSYTCLADFVRSEQLAQQGKRSELIENEKRRDTFSMGLVLYAALANHFPFPRDNRNFPILTKPDGSSNYIPLKRSDVPKQLEDLIKQMLHPDARQRPTAAQAFASFATLLKTNDSKTYAKIQKEISKGYVLKL